MPIRKDYSTLPPSCNSVASFTFLGFNLICQHLSKISPVSINHIRVLMHLQQRCIFRRREAIGLNDWMRVSPAFGLSGKKRKDKFNSIVYKLEELELVEIYPVSKGVNCKLTMKGELLCNQMHERLNNYYRSIFTQFNLVPIL
jgi:hypothetical protein